MRPATRVGRWIMLEGGSRRLSLVEYLLIKCRIKTKVALRPEGRL